jgi:cytochrome c oxidase subunit IV
VAEATTTDTAHSKAGHKDHGTKRYWVVWAILLACTGLTVWTGRQDLGSLNIVIALLIATFKATLVVLFFMHVKYSTRLTWAVVVGSIFWLAILIVLTMGDYLTRPWRTYG